MACYANCFLNNNNLLLGIKTLISGQRSFYDNTACQSGSSWAAMEIDASSLEVAKTSFLSILSGVDPCESASFVEWVVQHCSNINTNGDTGETTNYTSTTSAEKKLKKIVKDIKKRVPLQGIMASENICHPEEVKVKLSRVNIGTFQKISELPLHPLPPPLRPWKATSV